MMSRKSLAKAVQDARDDGRREARGAVAKESFRRTRLLNEELDKLVTDSSDRTSSVANKASFLAISAGVVVAASTAQQWTEAGIVGVCALALASLSLLCAAVALRPGKRPGLQAQRLVDLHLDTTRSADIVEIDIVRDKARVIAAQDIDLRSRASWVWSGFFSLAASTISLTVVYSIEVIGN